MATLQLEAIAACSSPEALAEAERGAQLLTTLLEAMAAG
jgi:histidinol-phosphate aminotransferase